MRPTDSTEKQNQRSSIEAQTAEFLARGGKVKKIQADVIDMRSHNEKCKNFKEANNGFVTGKQI